MISLVSLNEITSQTLKHFMWTANLHVHACLIVNHNNSTISTAIIHLKYVNLKMKVYLFEKNTPIKV